MYHAAVASRETPPNLGCSQREYFPSSNSCEIVAKVDEKLRVIGQEILDTASAEETKAVIGDLRRINRWLGGYRVSCSALGSLTPPEQFTILDVGAASSESGAALRGKFPGARVTSLDRLASHLASTSGARVVADAFRLPFGERSIDYVYCSLFLHHFSDEDVVRLLAGFAGTARRGVVVVDLERRWLARVFLRATRWFFRWHPITVHDAELSVQAGFTIAELERLAAQAGLEGARVRRHLPWLRLSLVWKRRR